MSRRVYHWYTPATLGWFLYLVFNAVGGLGGAGGDWSSLPIKAPRSRVVLAALASGFCLVLVLVGVIIMLVMAGDLPPDDYRDFRTGLLGGLGLTVACAVPGLFALATDLNDPVRQRAA